MAQEIIASGHEFPAVFEEIKRCTGRIPAVLMPAEIGGTNAFTPIWVGAMLRMPILDADTIGRAFPELQMSSCTLYNVSASPAYLADIHGNVVKVQAKDAHSVERIARQVTVAMGSRAAIALYLMNGAQARDKVVKGSISHAIAIGKAILSARKNKNDPTQAVLETAQGIKIGSGIIADVDHQVEGGFLKGKATLSFKTGDPIKLLYQNEFLIAYQGERMLACTPDILMLMEQETGTPVTSATLDYGMRVDLIALPAPDLWKTPQGLDLVGPRYFGYDLDYKPIRNGR